MPVSVVVKQVLFVEIQHQDPRHQAAAAGVPRQAAGGALWHARADLPDPGAVPPDRPLGRDASQLPTHEVPGHPH